MLNEAKGEAPPGILVVDDEPAIRKILELALHAAGFPVWCASNLNEALELYRKHEAEIPLALLDIRMPGADGVQVLSTLQAINPDLVCCFLSGDLGGYSEAELRALPGVADVITKPFSPAAIILRCRQLTQSDRRSSPRSPDQPVRFIVHKPEDDSGDDLECWVQNRSQGGLALWARSGPLPVGVRLHVRPADAGEDEPWAEVEVRHCRPQQQGWVFGCQLLATGA